MMDTAITSESFAAERLLSSTAAALDRCAQPLPASERVAVGELDTRASILHGAIASTQKQLGLALLGDRAGADDLRTSLGALRSALEDVQCMQLTLPDFRRVQSDIAVVMRDAEIAATRRQRERAAEVAFKQAAAEFVATVGKLKTAPGRIELAARLWLLARQTGNQQWIGHAKDVTEAHHVETPAVRARVEVIRFKERVAA